MGVWGNDVRVHGEAQVRAAEAANERERQPCVGCGYMIRGGAMCGDCLEYGAPRRWRWKYDPVREKHERVAIDERSCWHANVICGDPAYCREHGCQL